MAFKGIEDPVNLLLVPGFFLLQCILIDDGWGLLVLGILSINDFQNLVILIFVF